jgi:group I intron endonuclease
MYKIYITLYIFFLLIKKLVEKNLARRREKEITKYNSMIYRSLIKNGYSNFKLEILEYCDVDIVLEREQYYLDCLNPEYNMLNVAGSLIGFKHSEATKEAKSLSKKNNIISE